MNVQAAVLSDAMLSTLADGYGCVPRGARRLSGGHQSETYLLDCEDMPRVMKVGPPWRSCEELEWSYGAAAHLALAMPEAAVPYATREGLRAVRVDGMPVTLWPFVEGRCADPSSEGERDLAADVLGRMHLHLLSWAHPGERPPTSGLALAMRRPSRIPDGLLDPDLDAWLDSWRSGPTRVVGPIHGDFWCNNLLHDGSRVAAVIDWDDARLGSLDRELAWAVWEFCAEPGGAGLDAARADRFLDVYAAAGGPVPVEDRSFVVPLVREHLRYEALRAMGAAEHDGAPHAEYSASAVRAFTALRGTSLR